MRRIVTALIGLSLPLLSHSADIDAGKNKAQVCTACHGANGVSISDEIPNLAGQKITYITNQLKAFREGSRKNPLMNAMAAQLADADIDNVAAFFNSLTSLGESLISDTAKNLKDNNIAYPENYKDTFKLYYTIDQAGPKRVRYNYVNEAGMQGAGDNGEFADGTFILTEIYGARLDAVGNPVSGSDGHYEADKLVAYAVMEKRQGYGDAIPEELRNGNWNYMVFNAEKQPNNNINQAACLACHKPLNDVDYLFSYKELTDFTKK
jgi:cytochrome c553